MKLEEIDNYGRKSKYGWKKVAEALRSLMFGFMEARNIKIDDLNIDEKYKRMLIGEDNLNLANKNIQTIAKKYIKPEDKIEEEFREIMKSQGYERL